MSMRRDVVNRMLLGYYAATFLFVALDIGLDVNVRLSFLDTAPGWRSAYYALCFACAGLMLWRPDLSVVIGGVESIATLSALIINMGARAMMVAPAPNGVFGPVTIEEVINFVISGSFAYLSWSRGLRALHELSS